MQLPGLRHAVTLSKGGAVHGGLTTLDVWPIHALY